MSVNDRQTAKHDNQDKYEAAVLDFLDQEMAAVQPTKKGKEQTEELDALVSDLLKQVITESDQPASNRAASDEINKLISELAPLRETAPPAEKKAAQPEPLKGPSHADNIYSVTAAPKEAEKPAKTKPKVVAAPAAKAPQAPSVSFFALLLSPKNRIPVIAAAVVCLLLAIGIPVFFMKGSSTPAPNAAVTQTAAVAPTAPAASVPATPAPAPAATKASSAPAPVPTSKPSAAELKAAAQAQKQAAQAQKQSAPAVQPAPTPVNVPAPVPQAKEERPAVAQVAPPVQAPAPPPAPAPAPAPAPERPTVQIAENRTPAPLVVDRTPAPRLAGNAAADSSALDLQSPTATHAVPRVMTPAIQLSQVPPKYPELALRSRASGVVVLDLDIDSNGKVTKATPVSGPDLFYKEAINAVLRWKYKPASVGGSNVPSQSRVTLNFKLPK
jgi:TonB family protein